MGVVGSQGEESGGTAWPLLSRRRGRGELGPRGQPESCGAGSGEGLPRCRAGPAAHQAGSEPTTTTTVRRHVGPCTSSLSPQHLQAPLPTPSTPEHPQHRFPASPLHLGSLSGASNLEVFNTVRSGDAPTDASSWVLRSELHTVYPTSPLQGLTASPRS